MINRHLTERTVKPRGKLHKQLNYYLMCAPGLVWLVLFSIVPMFGILMAFQDFKPVKGIFGSEFIGMDERPHVFSWVGHRQ